MPEPTYDLEANIDLLIPLVFRDGDYPDQRTHFINYWQAYLQPLVTEPYEVLPEDTFNVTAYPYLVNHLIAKLVAYSMLLNAINKLLIAMGNRETLVDGSITNITVTPRQIKSIETGPGKTEWYEGKTESSEDIKNLVSSFNSMVAPGGAFEMLKADLCQNASRVLIYLPICDNSMPPTVSPIISGLRKATVLGLTPFGLVNKRLL